MYIGQVDHGRMVVCLIGDLPRRGCGREHGRGPGPGRSSYSTYILDFGVDT